jgi:hypothetical protein
MTLSGIYVNMKMHLNGLNTGKSNQSREIKNWRVLKELSMEQGMWEGKSVDGNTQWSPLFPTEYPLIPAGPGYF